MARPRKVGLDYFPFECQNDERIRLIQAEYGLKGFAIVVKLLQKIYGEFGYYCEWDEERSLLFASENGSSSDDRNLIEQVLMACIRRFIFSKDMFDKYSILTSSEIQENYLLGASRREYVELKKEYLLIKGTQKYKNVYINSVNVNRNLINVNDNTQSKVKKSKVYRSNINIASCPEPKKAPRPVTKCKEKKDNKIMPAEPAVITLLLNDKTEYGVTIEQVAMYQELYPAVDIMQQLRHMKGWLFANPDRRKTKKGINRFINTWLQKEQDRGRTVQYVNAKTSKFNSFEQRDDDLDGILHSKLLNKLKDN